MTISSASDSIEKLIALSSQLDAVEKSEGGDLTHIFIHALDKEVVFEPKPRGIYRLWSTLKKLFSKKEPIEQSLNTFQAFFSKANEISPEEYSKLETRYSSLNIESSINKLAEKLESIKTNIVTSRSIRHKKSDALEKITFTHLTVEERRVDAFEQKLKEKAEELLKNPDADYAKVLTQFSEYAERELPEGISRTDCNKNFKPKIEALIKDLQEAISAYVLGSAMLLDTLTPQEQKKQIAELRSVVMGSQDLTLHVAFESAIQKYEAVPATTKEKTVKVATTIPLFSSDNLYKTLAYIVYDLGTKGPSNMLSLSYLLGIAAPTLAIHIYNTMAQMTPSVADKKAFVITYLTQLLAKSCAPIVAHKFTRLA